MEQTPTVGRKPPACESKSEEDLWVGTHKIQTAPFKWSRGSTGFPVNSWMGKKPREEREVAVFRVQGKWRSHEGRDEEGEAAGLEKGRALEDKAAKWLRIA